MVFSLELLYEFIAQEVEAVGLSTVREAAGQLGRDYAAGKSPVSFTHAGAVAYAAMRLPGTFVSLKRVAEHVIGGNPGIELTVLDVFAGPGSATVALVACGCQPKRVVCVERSAPMRALGERLFAKVGLLERVEWVASDVEQYLQRSADETFDVVVAAYGLGELAEQAQRLRVVSKLWQLCQHTFVCVEPGTPRGAQMIDVVRSWTIGRGGWIEAPCPHEARCCYGELLRSWCHFSVRMGRSRISRLVDDAQLSYEDEKFCYIIARKGSAPQRRQARLVGHPRVGKAGVELAVCLPDGSVRRVVVPKRQRDLYRLARKVSWGDALCESLSAFCMGANANTQS